MDNVQVIIPPNSPKQKQNLSQVITTYQSETKNRFEVRQFLKLYNLHVSPHGILMDRQGPVKFTGKLAPHLIRNKTFYVFKNGRFGIQSRRQPTEKYPKLTVGIPSRETDYAAGPVVMNGLIGDVKAVPPVLVGGARCSGVSPSSRPLTTAGKGAISIAPETVE